jgi:hypothetical protein
MHLWDLLRGKRVVPREGSSRENEQAVLIDLRGDVLSGATYEQYDLKGLEEELTTALDGTDLGEFDSYQLTSSGAMVNLYGPDAESLFNRVEPVLRSYSLCEKAFVTIRQGPPGADYRVVLL